MISLDAKIPEGPLEQKWSRHKKEMNNYSCGWGQMSKEVHLTRPAAQPGGEPSPLGPEFD